MRQPLFKKFLALAGILVLACQALTFYQPPKAAAAVDPSNLISDSVFENVNSMNVSQISALVVGYGGSCIGSGFTTPDPHGWDYVHNSGYVYGGAVSGAQAIDSIALNYHLNPQVIITTLQKEQSIISGSAGCYALPDPSTAQPMNNACGSGTRNCTVACIHAGGCMNIAMSYGCPGYCNVNNEGFSLQLTLGSWLLRFAEERAYGTLTGYTGHEPGDENFCYSGPMVRGTRVRSASSSTCGGVQGNAPIFYDGTYTTQDGTSTLITNGATASLYYYTPFFNGNQSFVNLFQNTFQFGNSLSGACIGTEPQLPYVQRYYNNHTFEHFYSAYACDQGFLSSIGFQLEGPVFNDTPCTAGYATPVYRYYNPATGQHMWTTDNLNQSQLNAGGTGYIVEAGQVFCVAQAGMPGVHAVSRLYNPRTYLHIWAVDPGINDLGILSQAGYSQSEGPVFFTQ